MSSSRVSSAAGFLRRLVVSAQTLAPEQRRVALAAVLVLVSMLLPWYSKSIDAVTKTGLASVHQSKLAVTVPSFVEASIFLVAVALLALMHARGQGRAFHLPFGDGVVAMAAGIWTTFLIFFRFIDQPGGGKSNTIQYEYSLSWGIFFALLAGLFLIYSGARLRLADVGEPLLPGEAPRPGAPVPRPPRERAEAVTEVAPLDEMPTSVAPEPPRRRREDHDHHDEDGPAATGQLSFDEPR